MLREPTPAPAPSFLGALANGQSPHRRDAELRAFLHPARPTARHRLGASVEPYRIRPVLVEIAKARALPAAEGVVGQRHRGGYVDADPADLARGREVARAVAVAGVDGDAVAVFMVVHQLQAFGIVLGADDA